MKARDYRGLLAWLVMIPLKLVLAAIGLVIVYPMIKLGKEWQPWERESLSRPYTYREMALRNPAGGMASWFKHPKEWTQTTKHHGTVPAYAIDQEDCGELFAYPEPWTLLSLRESHVAGWRSGWRWRVSGWLLSFRYVRLRKGGSHYSELYVGFKLGSSPPLLDFALSARGWLRPRQVGK